MGPHVATWEGSRSWVSWCGLWSSDISQFSHSLHSCSHSDHDHWCLVFLLILLMLRLESGDHCTMCHLSPGVSSSSAGYRCAASEASAISCLADHSLVTSPCPGPATVRAQCAARLRAEHTCGQWQQHIITDKHNNRQWFISRPYFAKLPSEQ